MSNLPSFVKQALDNPYDDMRYVVTPKCVIAARAAIANLLDRSGIDQALEDVDDDTRREIVDNLAEIIQYVYEELP